jgi:hypothetical protein
MGGLSDLQRRRGELVVERDRLYDVESFLSAAGRVLIRVPGEPIPADTWDGVHRTCEEIRLRTEGIKKQVHEIDLALAGGPH